MKRLRLSPRLIRGILQIGISATLLVLIFRRIEWAGVQAALAQMSLPWFLGAWALFILGVVVRAVRWQVLLKGLAVSAPLPDLALWYFVGGFFNVLLPTGFGGDAVRVVELSQDTRRTGAVLNSVVVDRYLGLTVLLAMGLAAAALAREVVSAQVVALIALLLGGALGAGWLLTRPWWQRWAEREGFGARMLRKLRLPQITAGLGSYGAGVLLRAAAVSLLFNLMQIGWNVLIGLGLGLKLPLALYFVVVPLTSAALLLPAFGGLGVRELSYVALLGAAGVPEATALAFSLSIYAITVLTGLIGGFLYLAVGLRRVRRKI